MKLLAVNSVDRAAIEALNSLTPYRKIVPIQLSNGTYALNADLLNNCESSGIWGPYWEILGRLPRFEANVDNSLIALITKSAGHTLTSKPMGVHWYPGWKPNPQNKFGPPWNDPDSAWWWRASYPEREPLQGWYNEGLQVEVDRCLGYLGAHGVTFACFNWFWDGAANSSPAEHALLLTMSSSIDTVKFCIGWDPETGGTEYPPVRNAQDLSNICSHWNGIISNSKYFRYNGKPVIFLGKIEIMSGMVSSNSGMTHAQVIAFIRSHLNEPVYLISGGQALSHWTNQALVCGYDAYSAYNLFFRYTNHDTGAMGPMPTTFVEHDANYRYEWDWWINSLAIDLWLPLIAGFDARPWGGSRVSDPTDAELDAHFAAAALRLLSSKCKGGIVCAATEFGEGSIVMPTKSKGRARLEKFRKNFPAF